VALVITSLTWLSIRQSRADSLELLVGEGTAFTEALAQSAESVIQSEQVIDYFVHLRFSEIVASLGPQVLDSPQTEHLMTVARDHQVHGIFVFDKNGDVLAGAATKASAVSPPGFVTAEVDSLLAHPESNFVLLLDEESSTPEPLHYYLEILNTLDRVVLIIDEASFYVEAMQKTQIGFLAQNMAKEKGVVYIIYQTVEGIIFSSSRTDRLLSIESDSFLKAALEADSISYRLNEFEGETVLELVRPFSSPDFRFGLLRVGLSLNNYNAITRGYDLRMIIIAGAILALAFILLKYLDTRRRRVESEQRYERIKTITDRIFDQMRTGVAVVSSDGTITLANEAIERILSKSVLVNRKWDEITADERLSLDRMAPAGPRPIETEISINIGGERKTLLIAASRLSAENKSDEGTIIVVYDITRIREFEQESARRERLSEMGQLAAGVAHEIRNPLNAISIAAQRLAAEFSPQKNEDEYKTMTAGMKTETKRLDSIITRFLALAKSEKKKIEQIELKEFFAKDAAFLAMESEQLGIKLNTYVEPNIFINADRGGLMQIFTNLFNNSKEALQGNAGVIEINCRKDNGSIIIALDDSGPGVADDNLKEIFKPFFTTKENGTGLGLPTVHRIVREFGGEIKYERSKLGGARFVMVFKT
jgi:PAS domain S-box-containing protein